MFLFLSPRRLPYANVASDTKILILHKNSRGVREKQSYYMIQCIYSINRDKLDATLSQHANNWLATYENDEPFATCFTSPHSTLMICLEKCKLFCKPRFTSLIDHKIMIANGVFMINSCDDSAVLLFLIWFSHICLQMWLHWRKIHFFQLISFDKRAIWPSPKWPLEIDKYSSGSTDWFIEYNRNYWKIIIVCSLFDSKFRMSGIGIGCSFFHLLSKIIGNTLRESLSHRWLIFVENWSFLAFFCNLPAPRAQAH